MKNVTLSSLRLVNFKGHKDLTVNFGTSTILSGENATGKSTVFDSFVWLLFGKDQFDRKDFEIIPTVNGKRLDKVDSEVTAVILIDGKPTNLKRVLHQKWVRRRGTADEVFDGCETLYYINDVPKKASEYKAYVDTIAADETVFKLITNPTAFLSLHWTKQREFLFQIAGTVTDEEIASSDKKFAELLELLNGKSLVDFKKEISARKKKLKDDLDNIQPKIDQTTRLMPEDKDFSEVEAEVEAIDKSISAIDLQISDKAAAIREQYDDIQQKQKQINDLKTKQQAVVNDAKAKATQEAFEKNQLLTEFKNNIAESERALAVLIQSKKNKESVAEGLKQNAFQKTAEIENLRTEWGVENAKELTFNDNDFHCPTCKREFETGDVESKKAELLTNFKNGKAKKLAEINTKGSSLKSEIESINSQIVENEKSLSEVTESIEKYNTSLTEAKSKLGSIPEAVAQEVIASELPEWKELDELIKAIEATILDVKPVDNSELNNQKAELISKRDNLKKQLSEKDLIAKYKQEIKNLEAQGSDLAQKIADAEKQEFTADAFNRVKIEECDRRVNQLFDIVKFQLFDRTNDGNEFEACIPTNKAGIPIAATNTAERINAGIDIINSLSEFYKVTAPIFIDSAESVNKFINTKAQMIQLVVSTEPELTIK